MGCFPRRLSSSSPGGTAHVWNKEVCTLGRGSGWLALCHTLLPYPQEQGSGNYSPQAKYGPLCFYKLSFMATRSPSCVYYCLWLLSCYRSRVDSCWRGNMAGKTENSDYLALYSKSLPSTTQDSLADAVIFFF